MLRTALALSIILVSCSSGSTDALPDPQGAPPPRIGAERALGTWRGVETDERGGTAIDAQIVIESIDAAEMRGWFALMLDNPAVAQWSAESPFLLLTDATVIDFAIPDDRSGGLGSMACVFRLADDALDYRRFIGFGVARVGRLTLSR